MVSSGSSPDDALLLSSNEESNNNDFDDNQSDTLLPPLSELLQRCTGNVEFGGVVVALGRIKLTRGSGSEHGHIPYRSVDEHYHEESGRIRLAKVEVTGLR